MIDRLNQAHKTFFSLPLMVSKVEGRLLERESTMNTPEAPPQAVRIASSHLKMAAFCLVISNQKVNVIGLARQQLHVIGR